MRALGWGAGTRVKVCGGNGVAIVEKSAVGTTTLTCRAMVAIPARIRRRCGFLDCEQVLLVVEPHVQVLGVFGLGILEQALPDARDLVALHTSQGTDSEAPSWGGGE
ncbi:hypothetical protein [Actinokineospora cianjurensis]|nr:hypothetical protein [Actinokineospora cianjurensis]